MTAAADLQSEPIGVGYRPHLDGLRAVAVYLVVVFHAGADRALGGFIGVDVFFVLSGYLVTQLLMRDLRGRGSIDLRRFYSRRIRRLLPAASVVLLVTMVVFSAIGSPAELVDARGATRSAALYVSNWFFISESSQYFGADIQASPVVHFWSLSVEEQFYATWPLLLAGLHLGARRAGARRWSIVQGVVFVGMVASLAAALWIARTDLNRAYYGTDTRSYQLLAGAFLALSPGALLRVRSWSARQALPVVAMGALGGLVVLASSLVDVAPVTRGVLATALTAALIVSLEAKPAGPVSGFLSLPPIVYLGRISYGTYLWHWLVIVVIARVIGASPLSTALLATVVATGLAALSFELLERPVREARSLDRQRLAVVGVGLATSVLIGVVAVPRLLDTGGGAPPSVDQGTAVGATLVPDDLDWQGAQDDISDFPECSVAAPDGCTLVTGNGPHILLLGDSHARMYIPMLTALAEKRSLTVSAAVAPACPWQDGLTYLQEAAGCRAHHAKVYPDLVDELDPDLVILANRTFDDPASPIHVVDDDEAGELPLGSPEYLDSIRTRTTATVQALRDAGRRVLIIEPVPPAPLGIDPLDCLSQATYVDECRFVSPVELTPVEQIYRDVADSDAGVWTLDLDRRVCPYLPICDPIVGGLIVRRDTSHLTTRFAITLLDGVEQLLDDNAILE